MKALDTKRNEHMKASTQNKLQAEDSVAEDSVAEDSVAEDSVANKYPPAA
jgi:hypothetical protein